MPVSLNARRKFKDTPAGSIPVEWGCASLASLVNKPQYGTSVGLGATGPHPVLRMNAIRDGRIVEEDLSFAHLDEKEAFALQLKKGDLLFNRTNSFEKVGQVGLYQLVGYHAFASYLVRLSPRRNLVHPEFLAYAFVASAVDAKVKQLRSKGVSQSNINPTLLVSTVQIPLPEIEEQRAIADLLGAWDEAIRLHEDRLDALTERKRGLMQRLLTGRTRLPGFAGKWTSVRIGSLLKAEDRYVDFDDSETYDLVSIRRRAGGVYFRESLSGGEIKTKVLKRIKAGDLLISRMQVVHGALAVVPAELDGMCASDSYEALVPLDAGQLDMGFMNCLSQSPDMWYIALRCSHGVHIEKMTFVLSDFLHEKVTIPGDIAEQRAIAAVLTACDEEIALTRTATDALREQKRGLLQKLMTGRLRVPM